MNSLETIYTIGAGPSSSHSMGPAKAATRFLTSLSCPPACIKVSLYGSLAATGKGHLTDKALSESLSGIDLEIIWKPDTTLPAHSNAMEFVAFDDQGVVQAEWRVYSVGGGQLADDAGPLEVDGVADYPVDTFQEILEFCHEHQQSLWQYAEQGTDGLWPYLESVWVAMQDAVERGLSGGDAILPGGLNLKRRAASLLDYANLRVGALRDRNLLSAYALAVAEENAAGGTIVTAPTCGSCGVLPSILYFFRHHHDISLSELSQALAVGGLIGASVAHQASISGAEVGCQGEIGTACSMAAGAATFLLKGSNAQIEYAAEMGLEHFLGLTCDPIAGLVQVPCIERNAFAAMRAMDCAAYALATEGTHLVSFDEVVGVMNATGKDLQSKYRETARGGLAAIRNNKLSVDFNDLNESKE